MNRALGFWLVMMGLAGISGAACGGDDAAEPVADAVESQDVVDALIPSDVLDLDAVPEASDLEGLDAPEQAFGDPDTFTDDATSVPADAMSWEVVAISDVSVAAKEVSAPLDVDERAKNATSGLVPALDPAAPPRWKVVWQDEFNGPQTWEDPDCYTRAPTCVRYGNWGAEVCPPSANDNLAHLNKCNWNVYNFYCFWGSENSSPPDLGTAFDPEEVTVRGGELVLSAHADPAGPFDCGVKFMDGDFENQTRVCPFRAAGVDSRTNHLLPGMNRLYGRFEVRAKLSTGPGSIPTLWMMHQTWDYGWPYDGEFDLMEQWPDQTDKVKSAYHGGDPADQSHYSDHHHWWAKKDFYPQDGRKDTWHEDYHIWALEWDEHEARFYVDKWLVGITRNGQEVEADGKTYALKLPWNPFYWILFLTINVSNNDNWWENLWGDLDPDPSDFTPQAMHVDYVRVYDRCEDGDVGCVENTLSPWCPNPCQGMGIHTGYGCLVGAAPDKMKAYLIDGGFYYRRSWIAGIFDDTDCEPEHPYVDGKGCHIGDVPSGRSGFVINNSNSLGITAEGRFYLEPVCNSLAGLANCSIPCPIAGTWDGANCFVLDPGPTAEAFVYGGYFYTAEPCPEGSTGYTDGANHCQWMQVPTGTTGFVHEGRFYVEGACQALPFRDATGL